MNNQLQQNLSQSRILFEEVMVDNQPTEQQIIERAQELQIDDFALARDSLTKELEPHWRPYINRYGDIYYLNLVQKKAYIDHPIDMQTKILYSKRHKKFVPKFKGYDFQDISNSPHLINQQIKKLQKSQLLKSTQSGQFINSKLNIVYQQSQQSQTQKQNYTSQKQQVSEDSYIQNLQIVESGRKNNNRKSFREQEYESQSQNKYNKKLSFHRQQEQFPSKKSSFNQEYKRFPQERKYTQQQEQQIPLSSQYQLMLLHYQLQLRTKHQAELKQYQQQKKQLYLKKQQIIRQNTKAKKQLKKYTLLTQFESEIEQKNNQNLQKQKQKIKVQNEQKLKSYQIMLQNYQQIVQRYEQNNIKKQEFIQSLQERLQKRIIQSKFIKSQEIKKQIFQKHFVNQINQVNIKEQENFNRNVYQELNKKFNAIMIENNKSNRENQSYSISDMYGKILKKQLLNIDKILMENQRQRQVRKRAKSIFTRHQNQQKKSHIQFIDQQKQQKDKENNFIASNLLQKARAIGQSNKLYSNIIQNQIKSTKQNNQKFIQRRNRIFSTGAELTTRNSKQVQQKSEIFNKNKLKNQQKGKNPDEESVRQNKRMKSNNSEEQQKQNFITQKLIKSKNTKANVDKRSLYLRMMTRIL